MFKKICFFVLLFLFNLVFAHQPRIVEKDFVIIKNKEISQAFYGELKDKPIEFQISSDKDFELYVGLLLPDILNVNKDISAYIYYEENGNRETVAFLDGKNFDWKPFWEKYGNDHYLWGPEFKLENSKKIRGQFVKAGKYTIVVFSSSNRGKFVLATGYIEKFSVLDMFNAFFKMPYIKVKFFNYSFKKIFSSIYILGYLFLAYFIAFITSLILRSFVKKYYENYYFSRKNNLAIKLIFMVCGISLFLFAIFTSWNFILFYFSGLLFFESFY